MVHLTIDGRQVEVQPGTRVLDAARTAGIDIPTLCQHPDLKPYGGCRMCTVELSRDGRTWVTTSCEYPAEEGLVVQTQSPRAVATRRTMAELLLARTPWVPAIQRLAASVGVESPRFPPSTGDPEEACILCARCVRACDEIAGKKVLGRVSRSTSRRVSLPFEVDNTACDDCTACIPYCPTGAITQLQGLSIGRRFYEKAKGWIHARQIVQYGALALFALFFLTTSKTWWGELNAVNLFSRLDPLQAIGASLANRQFILLYLPALLTIAATLAFGRVWCGWICPLGAILHLFGPNGTRKLTPRTRLVKYVVLLVILLMAAFGSLAFMYFDPITILVRGVADPIRLVHGALDKRGVRIFTLASVLPLAAILVANVVERRFWCRYLCPLGALAALGSKVGWVRRIVAHNSCVTCGQCVSDCPMGAIHPGTIENDPAECVMCMDCAAVCPKTAITFERKPVPIGRLEFNPTRREFIGATAAASAAIVLLKSGVAQAKAPDLLRPPGVAEKEHDFLEQCIRCGQCVEACPGHALHPVLAGATWDTFWTPALVPRLGGCQYDCNRCGQVCPSGAIPNLALLDKRAKVIGTAVVDKQRCINCMVCEKVCPSKAIGRIAVMKRDLEKSLPVVNASKCNGCGQCEFDCPAPGSIKVYAPDRVPAGAVRA